jgi:hypothetical protein
MRGLLQRGPVDLDRQVDRVPRLPVHSPMERTGTSLQGFDMAGRCRRCTSNDEDAVIERVAAYMRESRMERVEDRTPWDKAGATWQTAFREMAVAARQALATD